jgi:hypothetical protein
MVHMPRTWTGPLYRRPKLKKMDMRFGTWNIRGLHRAGSLIRVAREVSNYVTFSGSTGGQMGQRWHRTSRRIQFFLWKGEWGSLIRYTHFLYILVRESSAVKRVEFVSDMISYIILRGRCCDVILNVHDPKEDKLMIWRTASTRN